MTRWWWVRHGPTHERGMVGWRDVPADLSDTARLARLSSYLPENALVVASDLRRAADTARAIAGQRKFLPFSDRLRETNFGVWDGLHWSEIAARDPERSRSFWENPGDITAPDGESWNQLSDRVEAFVAETTAAHPDTDIIAVAHFGVILTQLQRAAGLTAFQALGHQIDNLSVTQTTLAKDGRRLDRANYCP